MSPQRRQRVAFRLTMPSRGNAVSSSWGDRRNYVIVRTLPGDEADKLVAVGSWYHGWADGWGAQVTARVLGPGERQPKSDGFAGYDWMVDNILRHGSPYAAGEPTP